VVELGDIRGDLHGHTNLTDGVATLQEMVVAAQSRGYRYYALTDHAPLLSMQRMTAEKALEQRAAVRTLEERTKMALLHGSELNIQQDGSVDWDEEFLGQFDVLVASIHSHFEMPRVEMTKRLVRAIEHPCVNIIGHPTARRFGKRPSIDFDVDEVCKAAARAGTALEINSQPERMDLPDDVIRAARSYGVKFAISTDSHATTHLDFMRLGVGNAQRGWVARDDVVNAMSLRDLKRFLAKGRRGRG
jgi:DNA polymerase (family 10)